MNGSSITTSHMEQRASEEEVEPIRYLCISCKKEFEQWSARCPHCQAWSSIKNEAELEEEAEGGEEGGEEDADEDAPQALPVDQIDIDRAARIPTGISELDRVLGGGAVLGGVTWVGGSPGVGKSTLLLQALASLSSLGARTLYVTGEESASQVAARARRIEDVVSDNLFVLAETRVEKILASIEDIQPNIMVIDSVQTIHTREGSAGTVTQLREVTSRMIQIAKSELNISTFLVGHVTKDGTLAGPKVLEHLVDTVLAFEGERGQAFRTLRTQKNRFGSATEVGIFEMTAEGMREVPNASAFFLAERNLEASGSIIAATSESNRSMLVEVQALVSPVKVTGGRITSNGIDTSRLAMILAILEKTILAIQGETSKSLAGRDIFVNLAGGVAISEPALDLPIALAITSSLLQTPLSPHLVAFGEVDLTGAIRGVPRVPARISEASTMGFQQAVLPRSVSGTSEGKKSKKNPKEESLDLQPVRTLQQALQLLFRSTSHEKKKKRS